MESSSARGVGARLEMIKELVDQLQREVRAALRPWVLAVFDSEGRFSEPRHAQRARDEGLPQ
jgi:hypothetical protein